MSYIVEEQKKKKMIYKAKNLGSFNLNFDRITLWFGFKPGRSATLSFIFG